MRSDRGEQRVRVVRHVAIQAVAARPSPAAWCVCSLRPGSCRALARVALRAHRVCRTRPRLELVSGVAVVHRVAGEARHLTPQVTAGMGHRRVLASAGEDRTVRPPALAEEARVAVVVGLSLGVAGCVRGVMDVVPRVVEVAAWPVALALGRVGHALLGVGRDEHAVALAADHARPVVRQLCRVDDRTVVAGAAGRRRPVGGRQAALLAHVLLARPVAQFARDPEFRDARLELAPTAVVDQAGNPARAVALDAVVIPLRQETIAGRAHECLLARDPLFVIGQVDQRQRLQQPAVTVVARDPVGLVVVRAGRHHDLPLDAGDLVDRVAPAAHLDHVHRRVRVGHFGPESAVALEHAVLDPAGVDDGPVELAEDRLGGRELRHRAVETRRPRGVLAGVALHAGRRGDVPAVASRLRQVLLGQPASPHAGADRRGHRQRRAECGGQVAVSVAGAAVRKGHAREHSLPALKIGESVQSVRYPQSRAAPDTQYTPVRLLRTSPAFVPKALQASASMSS